MTIDFNRSFMDLTEQEVREIVTDMFCPKKITCFKKKANFFKMKVYVEWETYDDDGKLVKRTIGDDLELRDPWKYGTDSVGVEYAEPQDTYKLKQFCFAKGICSFARNNPYLK